ncbi:hypothetical protein [Paenibacillus oleatilyticus]|uniref:Radical SAM core domain-containing protein n=1 Tax=Paenibacillus oleatilyticus TaxID=2594886 RepID=A0ABV4VA72_9BACL
MFIDDVVTKIWEPVSDVYQKEYNNALSMEPEKLFDLIIEEVKRVNTVVFQSRELNMIALVTSGCPHNVRNGTFSGCSFCDYNSTETKGMAMINALKAMKPDLYAKVVRFSLEHARDKIHKPSAVELITAYDCLNPREIPEQVYEEVIDKGEMFNRKVRPFKSIFETRATSINYDKILSWKKNLGKKVMIEFGVEIGDEWMRNHWINKNLSAAQVEKAISVIHQAECESSANLLIGVPGCTEEQSIALFKDSVIWLADLGVDHILCSPLGRKERTLQGYLHDHMRDNERLQQVGLVCAGQTGMPWIFTVVNALYAVGKERPDIIPKLSMSPANVPPYLRATHALYKGTDMEQCVALAETTLKEFYNVNQSFEKIKKLHDELVKNPAYDQYEQMLQKQKKAGDLTDTLVLLAEELSKTFWPMDWESRVRSFRETELVYLGA